MLVASRCDLMLKTLTFWWRHISIKLCLFYSAFSESENAQSLMVKKQLNDLKEENESLKSSVHRLSVELSSYQAQYRPINPEQTVSS